MTVGTVDRVEDRLLERWLERSPHGSAALIQGPEIPTLPQIFGTIRRLTDRLKLLSGWSWVAAASLIGFEGVEVLILGMLAAPEFVPAVILALAIVAVVRDYWRRRTTSGLRRRNWLR